MAVKSYINGYRNLVANNNALKMVILILGAVILIEGVFILKALNSEKTIVVPNVSGKYIIGGTSANPTYIKTIGTYLVSLVQNFTPNTIDGNYREFLNYASPRAYGKLQSTLINNAKTYQKDDASSFFTIKSEKVLSDRVVVSGQSRLIIGSNVVSDKKLQVSILYKITNGEFEVIGYVEKNINNFG